MQEFQRLEMKMDDGFIGVLIEIDMVHTILNKHTALLEMDELEHLSLGVQVGRHDDWIVRAATKIGIRYSHTS